VVPHAVQRRHASGQHGGAIGHAHRAGHVEAIEPSTTRSEGVDVWRSNNGIAVATEMVRPMLVGDEHQDIGSLSHDSAFRPAFLMMACHFSASDFKDWRNSWPATPERTNPR